MIKALQDALYAQEDGKDYGATVVGHSLGGWLSQLTGLIAHHENKGYTLDRHLKVVTFDSPSALKSHDVHARKRGK